MSHERGQGHHEEAIIIGIATLGLFLVWEYILVPLFWKIAFLLDKEST